LETSLNFEKVLHKLVGLLRKWARENNKIYFVKINAIPMQEEMLNTAIHRCRRT